MSLCSVKHQLQPELFRSEELHYYIQAANRHVIQSECVDEASVRNQSVWYQWDGSRPTFLEL